MIASNIWDDILSRVQAKVNRHSFYTWFKPTAFVFDDGQIVTVRVKNVNGGDGSNDVPFGFLIGDVNGNRVVDIPDKNQVNADKGQVVNGSNFRDDINLSGKVDKPDLNAVNANKNHHLP